MIRRLSIAAAIFVALFLAVFVYNYVAGENTRSTENDRPQRTSTGQAATRPRQLGSGKFHIERRDNDGKLVGVYKAKASRKLSENSFALTTPLIRLYRPTGERIYIYADHGTLYAAEVGTEFEPRRGVLKGQVRVFIDRSTDPTRPAELTPDRDMVRIYGDEVEFDADALSIRIGGEVSMLSAEADIFGRDLSIVWNEAPKTDLKQFTLAEGRSMIVYEAENILSGSTEPPSEPPGGSAASGRTATPAADFPSLASALGGLMRTAETPGQTPEAIKPHNIYLATFHNDVHVFSSKRSMRYARTLALTFEWDRDVQGMPGDDSKRRETPPAPARTVAPVPVPLIAMTASGANPAEPPARRPARGPATTRPANRNKGVQPTVILWSGPLVVEPIGRTKSPSKKRYYVEAKGKRIVWETEELAATCQNFSMRQQYDGKETVQAIRLAGGPGAPVRLARTSKKGGQRIRCSEITFLPDGGRAELLGPGRIINPAPDQDVNDPLLALDLDELPDPTGSERITWSKALVATLESARTADKAKEESSRYVITGAVLTGEVELRQAEGRNFVQCNQMLQIWTSPSKRSASGVSRYLSRAKAIGNAQARQEGRDIAADELTVDFAERDQENKPAATKPRAPEEERPGDLMVGKVRAVRMGAEGNVRISDTRGSKPLVATADRLVSNLVDEKAVLEGDPARIVQGDSHLHGPTIHLDQTSESLVVVGAGGLKFNTDRDLDGKVLDAPRPLVTAWNKQMTFTGKKDAASFVGGVTVVSGDDRMSAREMDLAFEKTLAPKVPPKPTAGKAAKKPGEAGMTELGLAKRRIKTIVCRGGVSLNRVKNDAMGRLTQRIRLTGEQLTYDAGAEKDADSAKMTVAGAGTMFMGDYRPPKPKPGVTVKGWEKDKPSQTYFTWKRGMEFSQTVRQVVLHGGVRMEHRTGDQIAKAKKLNIPALGPLPTGRSVTMKCLKMIASFGDAVPDAKADSMTLGRLRRFRATGDIDLSEGRLESGRRMLGQMLNYDRVREIVVIEGTRKVPATLMYQPSPTETLKAIRSPRIECFLKDDKIVRVKTAEITGGS